MIRKLLAATGAGCNFVARDVTGDGKVDIFHDEQARHVLARAKVSRARE